MKKEKKLTKRDIIVSQAYDVFYAQGFQATCVDKVLASTGISKRTLYKYFRSKEELIAAAVEHYQHILFADVIQKMNETQKSSREKILFLFDLKKADLEAERYSGCFAINAKLEYDGKEPQIERACSAFVDDLRAFIEDLCVQAGYKNPAIMAMQLMILLEGLIVYGQAKRDPEIAVQAKNIAMTLLR